MSEKNKQPVKQPVKKVEQKATATVRAKPLGIMLFYEAEAVAMGFTGKEDNLSRLIKNKVRQTLGLPAPERSSGSNAVLKAQLRLPATATTNELNKALKQAILSGKFKPAN